MSHSGFDLFFFTYPTKVWKETPYAIAAALMEKLYCKLTHLV
jgi:hypothetical protein